MSENTKKARRRAKYDVQLDRHEAKYVIPKSLVPDIREFVRPFCEPDPHCKGDPPSYVVTTLQLDADNLSLHHAKENEALNRFKLRARIYGEPGESPVFMEIKRKIRGTIIKSRTVVPFDAWDRDLVYAPWVDLDFKSPQEEVGFLEFRRLSHEIGAEPKVLIRYVRESYFGKLDHYARVTMDRHLEYQPTRSWTSFGRGGRWISVDTPLAQNKRLPFSGVILELKTLSEAPRWMIDLIVQFNLERVGNCKYSSGIWLESLFCPTIPKPTYAPDVLTF